MTKTNKQYVFKSLKSVLHSFSVECQTVVRGKKGVRDSRFSFFNLIKSWPEIVGEKLANHSIPLKNNNKVLTILTDHPQWAQELSFLETKIKRKIFRAFPELRSEIKSLKFQADNNFFSKRNIEKTKAPKKKEADSPPPLPKLHQYSPKYQLLKSEADKLFEEIDDDETKDLLTSIYISYKDANQ